MSKSLAFFAPQLTFKTVLPAIDFYQEAFGAQELRRWSNDDGSVHVAEMHIDGALFHLHEEVPRANQLSPESCNGISVLLGLFVDDVHGVMKRAVAAGGKEVDPVQDYDYGYRQGVVTDPFGYQWMLEKKI